MPNEVIELSARRRIAGLTKALDTHRARTRVAARSLDVDVDGELVARLQLPIRGTTRIELPARARSVTLKDELGTIRAWLPREELHDADGRVDDGRLRLQCQRAEHGFVLTLATPLSRASRLRRVLLAAVALGVVGLVLLLRHASAPGDLDGVAVEPDPAMRQGGQPRLKGGLLSEVRGTVQSVVGEQVREREQDALPPEPLQPMPSAAPSQDKRDPIYHAPRCPPGDPLCTDIDG